MEYTKIQLIDEIKKSLSENNNAALEGLMMIYKNQTLDEKTQRDVCKLNGVGFNHIDVKLLSVFAEMYIEDFNFNEKMFACLKRKMPKYAKQIFEMSLANNMYMKLKNKKYVKNF